MCTENQRTEDGYVIATPVFYYKLLEKMEPVTVESSCDNSLGRILCNGGDFRPLPDSIPAGINAVHTFSQRNAVNSLISIQLASHAENQNCPAVGSVRRRSSESILSGLKYLELRMAAEVDFCIDIKHITAVLLVTLAASCTAIQDDQGQPTDEVLFAAGQQVGKCTFKAHMQCIYLTASETIDDGRQVKWTRHWFRMSYIGRACEAQYGKATGIALESLFAIPHYLGIGVGNTLSVFLYPFDQAQADKAGPADSVVDQTQDTMSADP